MLFKNSIRKKWKDVLFKYHGVRRVFENFDSNSKQILLLENFLSAFFRATTKHNNRYPLIGALDYNFYEDYFYEAAKSLFDTLIVYGYPTEDIDYEIEYEDLAMYVILK